MPRQFRTALDMASQKITSLLTGTASTDAANVGQITPLDAWIPDANTWTWSSVSGHTSVVTVNADLTAVIEPGDRIKCTNNSRTQYFIVTKISVSAGTTTITMYGGAIPIILNASYANGGGVRTSITVKALDYAVPNGSTLLLTNGDAATVSSGAAAAATSIAITSVTPATTDGGWTTLQHVGCTNYVLANSAITAVSYSHVKNPFGFPADPALWTEIWSEVITYTKSTPLGATWYTPPAAAGSAQAQLSVPIGAWRLSLDANALATGPGTGVVSMYVALSTSTSAANDQDLVGFLYLSSSATTTTLTSSAPVHIEKNVVLTTATVYTAIMQAFAASYQGIQFSNQYQPMLIRAICAYL